MGVVAIEKGAFWSPSTTVANFTLLTMTGKPGFNPRSRHTKDLKMVLDTSLLKTQKYKVRIEGKMLQSRERGSALPFTSV